MVWRVVGCDFCHKKRQINADLRRGGQITRRGDKTPVKLKFCPFVRVCRVLCLYPCNIVAVFKYLFRRPDAWCFALCVRLPPVCEYIVIGYNSRNRTIPVILYCVYYWNIQTKRVVAPRCRQDVPSRRYDYWRDVLPWCCLFCLVYSINCWYCVI